jgi:Tfp pilus assembly protein PilO
MVQVLHLSNGETLNPKLADDSNRIAQLLSQQAGDGEIITQLFQVALSRKPTDAEIKNLLAIVAEYGDDRATALQDVAWSILTSTEFTFNH